MPKLFKKPKPTEVYIHQLEIDGEIRFQLCDSQGNVHPHSELFAITKVGRLRLYKLSDRAEDLARGAGLWITDEGYIRAQEGRLEESEAQLENLN